MNMNQLDFFSSGQRKVAPIRGGHINGVVVNLGSTERKPFKPQCECTRLLESPGDQIKTDIGFY